MPKLWLLTLLLLPLACLGQNNAAAFDFYAADNPANYRIIVEGIDAAGNIGRAVYKCRVQ